MSFAGRRRGNKVKKGVQFTVMVVGTYCPNFRRWVVKTRWRWIRLSNVLCCFAGASGTGRTTFVNTLCESEVLPHKVCDSPETAHLEEGIRIKPATVGELHECAHVSPNTKGCFRTRGGRCPHCVDYCGYPWLWRQYRQRIRVGSSSHKLSTAPNCISSFQEIVGYLERQYDDILAEESRIKRNPRFRDNRVHALLYFIAPTGHA